MKPKTEYFSKRVLELIGRLGVPIESPLKIWNYDEVLKKLGAETWCERDRVFYQPETRELSTIAPGAQIVLIAKGKSEEFFTLIQIRKDGKNSEEEIGFPGGASNMWKYKDRVELEHPVLTAYREFYEEVGFKLNYEYVEYLAYTTSTNHYNGYPDTYAPSMYYYTEVSFEAMQRYGAGKGSEEGRIKMVPIKELNNYKWFPNAKEIFELLLENYGE